MHKWLLMVIKSWPFMQDVRDRLVKEVAKECKTVEDVHNTLKDLFKLTIQDILESEMSVRRAT